MSKEVALKNETLPNVIDFEQFEDEGYGFVSRDDILIPRIVVVQALSGAKKKNNKNYVEGANDGDIIDATGKEILAKEGETITFLPVDRIKEIIEWNSSQQGVISNRYKLEEEFDSFVKRHGVKVQKTREGNKERIKYLMPNGNEIVNYVNIYGILIGDGWAKPAFIPFKGGSLRVEKEWLSKMRDLRKPNKKIAPIFYSTWQVGSKLTSNSSNDEWFIPSISKGAYLSHSLADGKTIANSNLPPEIANDLFEAVKNLLEILKTGEYNIDLEDDALETRSDDVPF